MNMQTTESPQQLLLDKLQIPFQEGWRRFAKEETTQIPLYNPFEAEKVPVAIPSSALMALYNAAELAGQKQAYETSIRNYLQRQFEIGFRSQVHCKTVSCPKLKDPFPEGVPANMREEVRMALGRDAHSYGVNYGADRQQVKEGAS